MNKGKLFKGLLACSLSLIALANLSADILAEDLLQEKKSCRHNWGYIDLNASEKKGKIVTCQKRACATNCSQHLSSSSSSHREDPIVLFEANTSRCRIGIDDRALIETGQADFVTAFSGNDFSCQVIKAKCPDCFDCAKKALQILPANGSSFTTTVPPAGENGPVPGGLFDHAKFVAYSVNTTAPQDEGTLSTTWIASGAQLNVANNPFGSAVKNPNEDARLACYALAVLDTDLLLTFDFIGTNDLIYAVVERLPTANTDYAAFTYLIPIYKLDRHVNPLKDIHKYESRYNRAKGTMTWLIDDCPVFEINKFGVRLTERNAFIFDCDGQKKGLRNPQRFKILEHGGKDQELSPVNLQTGLAFFTLLDGSLPNNLKGQINANTRGLVRLESSLYRTPGNFFYYNPFDKHPTSAATFVIDSILNPLTLQYAPLIPTQYRLFGQGAALRLFHYDVSIKE